MRTADGVCCMTAAPWTMISKLIILRDVVMISSANVCGSIGSDRAAFRERRDDDVDIERLNVIDALRVKA